MTVDQSRKIHEQITEETWAHGHDGDDYSSCLVNWTLERYGWKNTADDLIIKELGFETDDIISVINWNDAPERTFTDVLTLLRKLDI